MFILHQQAKFAIVENLDREQLCLKEGLNCCSSAFNVNTYPACDFFREIPNLILLLLYFVPCNAQSTSFICEEVFFFVIAPVATLEFPQHENLKLVKFLAVIFGVP